MVTSKIFFAEDRKKGWTRAAVDLAYNGECRSVSLDLMHAFPIFFKFIKDLQCMVRQCQVPIASSFSAYSSRIER